MIHEGRERAVTDLGLLTRQAEHFLELLDANKWGPPQFSGKPKMEYGAMMHEVIELRERLAEAFVTEHNGVQAEFGGR